MPGFFKRAGFRLPDLVTVIVEPDKDGSLKVIYVAEGSTPPESGGYGGMDALVAAVDQLVLDYYAEHLGDRVMGLQYAWYPWGDHKPPKNAGLPKTFYLMYEARTTEAGYAAGLADDASVTLQAGSLQDLAQAAQAAALERWPVLASSGIPGMIHWNRELASGQFRDVVLIPPAPSLT